MRRGDILILLLIGWALVILIWTLTDRLERMAACEQFGTADACCQRGECSYKPASDESRPYRP